MEYTLYNTSLRWPSNESNEQITMSMCNPTWIQLTISNDSSSDDSFLTN